MLRGRAAPGKVEINEKERRLDAEMESRGGKSGTVQHAGVNKQMREEEDKKRNKTGDISARQTSYSSYVDRYEPRDINLREKG